MKRLLLLAPLGFILVACGATKFDEQVAHCGYENDTYKVTLQLERDSYSDYRGLYPVGRWRRLCHVVQREAAK